MANSLCLRTARSPRPRRVYDRRRVKDLAPSTTGMPKPIAGAGATRQPTAVAQGPACAAAARLTNRHRATGSDLIVDSPKMSPIGSRSDRRLCTCNHGGCILVKRLSVSYPLFLLAGRGPNSDGSSAAIAQRAYPPHRRTEATTKGEPGEIGRQDRRIVSPSFQVSKSSLSKLLNFMKGSFDDNWD